MPLMASKSGSPTVIPERKLRQIWDAIESRQFKNALKHTNALLAKFSKSPYVIAIKALVVEKLGKPEEALAACLEAKERIDSDDAVHPDALNTLQMVFQRLDRLDLATSCYEHACRKSSTNVELLMGLFNCYVREYSFVKQQQIALKLYKLVGEDRFLLWAVCSIQLQVLCGDGGNKLLLLAEGLLKKHVAAHGLHEPEAILMYIAVLEQQAKYTDALAILAGDLGALIALEVDRLRLKGRLLARSRDYAGAAEVFAKILKSCPDDWDSFQHYLSCLLEDDRAWSKGAIHDQVYAPKVVDYKISHLSDEEFDLRMRNASNFIRNLQVECAKDDSIRCPYLAHLEIERRKRQQGRGEDVKFMGTLLTYFFRFGHLPCFAPDAEIFLQDLTTDERIKLVKKFLSSCESMGNTELRIFCQKITIYKVQEISGFMFKLPVGELENNATHMTELYCRNLHLSKDLDPQGNMHGEELLSMACNVLVQLFWRTRNLGYLLEAVLVLEFGLTVRRFISQYKILLVHLYSHLGAFPLAYMWYKTLDIKNILLESVSHHILPQMLTSPLWAELTDLLREYLNFMNDHLGESADLTFLAYRHRNYTKVVEFVRFKNRLQNSHQFLKARLEDPILQLKQKADNVEEVECVLRSSKSGIQLLELPGVESCKSLTFNEDMQSRPWWTPAPEINYLSEAYEEGSSPCPAPKDVNSEQSKGRETSLQKIIERRSLVPRLIYLSIQSTLSLKENVEAGGSIADGNNSEFLSLLERYARNLGFSFDDAVDVIAGMSSGQKPFEVYSSDIVDWMNFAVFLNAWKLGSPDKDGCKPGSWGTVDSMFKKFTDEKLQSIQPLIKSTFGDIKTLVGMVTEPLAWHILIIQSCVRSAQPTGKKKKKGVPAEQMSAPLSQAIQDSIQSMSGTVGRIESWLREQVWWSQDEDLDNMLLLLQRPEGNETVSRGPGQVFRILQSLPSSMADVDLKWITEAVQPWDGVEVLRKIINSQRSTLSEFLGICELKSNLLQQLKQQMLQL